MHVTEIEGLRGRNNSALCVSARLEASKQEKLCNPCTGKADCESQLNSFALQCLMNNEFRIKSQYQFDLTEGTI